MSDLNLKRSLIRKKMFAQFIPPLRILIYGPSGSGKKSFLENLITKKNDLFNVSKRLNTLRESLKQLKIKRVNQFFYSLT